LQQKVAQENAAAAPPVVEVFDRARGIGAIPKNLRERYILNASPPRTTK